MPTKLVKKTKTVKKKSIRDKIIPIAEAPAYDTMLVYGRAGTGKTEFGSTFPTPLLLIDIREEGHKTVKKKSDIDLLQVETWDELEEIYWELHGGMNYESIVIDQVTAMQALAMAGVRDELGMKPSETLSQRSWGKISGRMQEWLFNFRELTKKDYNVCFLAHERLRDANEEDDDRIAPSVGANLMPSIASYLNGAVSVIGNSFIREKVDRKEKTKETQFCMRVGPHPYYAAKIRRPVASGPAPDVIINPTYEKVMKVAEGESLNRKIKRVKK